MGIVYVGIDLAKNVFAVHGVDEHGKPALMRPASRAKLRRREHCHDSGGRHQLEDDDH